MRIAINASLLVAAALTPAAGQAVANGMPAVSGDGRRIAYLGTHDGHDHLMVVDVDGAHNHEVAGAPLDINRPQWSATGELVFSGGGADSSKAFAIPVEGGVPRVVAVVPGRAPTMSPDGHRVAYLVGTWTSTALIVADASGSNARTIAGGHGTTAWNTAWSPDGRQIGYTFGDSTRLLQVYVIGADGRGDRALTHTTVAEGSAQVPAWSPDRRRLAIQVNNHPRKSSEVWIVDIATGTIHHLAPHAAPYLDETPTWFPDGSHLAFQSNRTGTMEIWVMNADGSGARQVTGSAAGH